MSHNRDACLFFSHFLVTVDDKICPCLLYLREQPDGALCIFCGRDFQVPAVQPSMPSNTRFALGDYIADVLLDERHQAKVFHWIVQRAGSTAIIMSGQETTYQGACSEAQSYLRGLVSRDKIHPA